MSHDRRLRILERFAIGASERPVTRRLCEVCAEVTGASGAGIMLMSGGLPRGSICTTDPVSARIEDLQFTLGEGPSIDACAWDRPVLEPDLATPLVVRWPVFSPPAVAAGARAVFGFPVRVGAGRLGAINLHRSRPGPLDAEQHADALVLADLAAETILLLQANATPGQLAVELERGADFHFVVHQASGMVAAQLDTNVIDALVRLRAHSFANDTPLADVARAVVDRTLRFAPPTINEEA